MGMLMTIICNSESVSGGIGRPSELNALVAMFITPIAPIAMGAIER